MTILDIYDAVCWHEASNSMLEDILINLQHEAPIAWRDMNMDRVLQAVAIAKLNARETRRSMREDAIKLLED
jgi:hypothetical protein